jgi:hypothetical protein
MLSCDSASDQQFHRRLLYRPNRPSSRRSRHRAHGDLKSPQQSKNDSQIRNSQIGHSKGKSKAEKSRDQWPAERTSLEELRTTCYTKRASDLNSRDYIGDTDETGSQSSLSRNAVYQTVEFRWEEEYEAGKSKPREIPL